jgi:acyl-CoA synthetase (AMP-forming)/AMP-acid ligase II
MQLTQELRKAQRECPNHIATVCGSRRQNYAQLVDRVERLAGVLRRLGVEPGDRVGMLGLNSDRYIEYFYATLWAGAAVNPVNVRWSAAEIAYSLDHCDTRVLLVDDAFLEMIERRYGASRKVSQKSSSRAIHPGRRAPYTTKRCWQPQRESRMQHAVATVWLLCCTPAAPPVCLKA